MNNNYIAIMAGGIGSRFWPASRSARPKQFLDILGVGRTLLQLTYERALRNVPKENIFIVTNEQYRSLIKEQLPAISDNQILGEPSRNNTAPCLAYTALKLQALNPNANFVVASSDHIILKEEEYVKNIALALEFVAQHDALVTLGITPTFPSTGYGYINYESKNGNAEELYKVNSFTEKPDLSTAMSFLEDGNYVWNAGIFVWSVKSLLHAFSKYASDIIEILDVQNTYNTAAEKSFIDSNYPKTRDVSIDYAILEKADNVFTIPSDIGWSDLGTWGSLHVESEKDSDNNVIHGDHVMTYDVTNCLVRVPSEKLVVLKGLDDYIIIDEGDILMIVPKSQEQEIKQITKDVGKHKGELYI
ncbi:MAG: mannose-1-phosphate guanylyltransferase [Saprospiraceae bacterium]